MDSTTNIQYEAVKNDADEIMNRSTSMDNLFGQFRKTMSEIYQDDVFAGVASESFHDKFQNLQTKFDNYVKTVEEFSQIIEKARSETQATENEIRNATEDLAE